MLWDRRGCSRDRRDTPSGTAVDVQGIAGDARRIVRHAPGVAVDAFDGPLAPRSFARQPLREEERVDLLFAGRLEPTQPPRVSRAVPPRDPPLADRRETR